MEPFGGSHAPGRKQLSLSLNHHSSPQSHGVSSSYSAPRTTTLDQAKTTDLLSTQLGVVSANPSTVDPVTVWKLQPEGQSLLKTSCSFHTHFGPPTQLHPSTPHRLTVSPAHHMPPRPTLIPVFLALVQNMQLAAIPSFSPA